MERFEGLVYIVLYARCSSFLDANEHISLDDRTLNKRQVLEGKGEAKRVVHMLQQHFLSSFFQKEKKKADQQILGICAKMRAEPFILTTIIMYFVFAVKSVLQKPISLIQGPPRTGKQLHLQKLYIIWLNKAGTGLDMYSKQCGC